MGRARRRRFTTRPPLERMQWLDRQLRRRAYPGAADAAAMFEVSRRTILRDIDYMRAMLGAPIEYDRGRRGYYYADDTFNLSAIQLTEGELFSILVAEKALRQYRGAPYEACLESAFEKIRRALPEQITVDLSAAETRLSFDVGPTRPPDLATFRLCAEAVARQAPLRLCYHTQSRNRDTIRVVEPYHLHNHQGDWYLIAYCRTRRGVRHFLVSRILRIEILDEPFESPRDFDFQSYAKHSFGIEQGGRAYRIAVWFDSYEARWIRERTWHETQRLIDHADGSLTLEFQASGLDEIARWVLSYGEHAVVLKPKRLREQVARAHSEAARNYQKKIFPALSE